ncbi:MAG: Uma2 family endonuclease [Chloroflexi bacterium]|nr:Uma2 family endonuclease [Chloroflexota bacterium]
MTDIQKKNLTYTDYQTFSELPENKDRLFEFIDGDIIEKMPSFESSEIATEIIYHLKHYLKQNPLGRLTAPDGGYIMSNDDNPDVFIPDVGYITNERLGKTPEREAPVPPDLAVEVKSPTDRLRATRRKAEKYLAYGTRLVWVVFPETKTVEVYDIDSEDVQILGIEGTLSGGNILPGFTLAVKDIFPTD